uniref:Uncharacterized protein n=1 Tax=Anopheles quadriannulatus TaxID=34691 RepID=A0A182X6A2_ANOQN
MEKPEEVTIQVQGVDNRTVIEVKGKHIVLSQIKPRVEALLANSAIEEVRIFAGINLRIDADLSSDVWRGRNLVVLANEIKVLYRVIWDVSGKDNNLMYITDAGTDGNGHGKGGNDGYPGESGGNVLLQANSIQDPDRLTIISNGGNGSGGQNGDNQQKNIDTIIAPLEAELKKQQNDEVLRLWYESVGDNTLPEDLKMMLRNDKALSSLYDKLTVERNAEYNWERCCADEKIQEIFKISLEKEGIVNKSYRVLLAYVFNVNIRVYDRDENNEIELIENHNHKSTTVIHVLKKVNKFIQLKMNEAYRLLEEERLHKDSIYRQILTEVSTMQIEYVFVPNFKRKLLYQNSSSKQKTFDELDDEAAITKISEFFLDEEREQIVQRLENISPKYSGQHGVFENILQRFSFEGRHVSFNEFSFLINSIITHSVQARQERYTFSWIVAAYNQCNWTDELVLLQFENFLKRQLQDKSKWRRYMSNIDNKGVLLVFAAQFGQNPCSEECVEEILHLLSSIPIESVNLDQFELSEWPYILKEYYWTYKFKSLMPWDNELASLSSATFYALSNENTFGDKLMSMLFELLEGKRNELTHAGLNKILKCFHTQKWNLCIEDLNVFKRCSVKEWVQYMEKKYKINSKELTVSQIVAIIKGNSNTSSNIVRHLSRIENSVANIHYNETTFNTKKVSSFLPEDIEQWTKQFQDKIKKPNAYVYEEMLAVIDRAIKLKRNFRLRDTQRLTVLALLANDKSTLAQVSTGEGKTIIVVAITIIKVLLGEKVDIITSSSVLAKRDADENKDIYELFGLSASHNCSEVIEERKEAYSSNQIIYGDLGNFQRDYLLDRVYGKNVLGDRSFQNVIVDEVDSMLLDKGNNILYLSHDIAGMDKLESVFVFIWQMVNSATDQTEDVLAKKIKQSLLCDMYALIQKEDIQSLDNVLSISDGLMIWERLIQSEIINDSGRLLVEAVDSNKLDEILSSDFAKLKDRLSFLLWSRIERETYVTVPNYLKAFVERHLDSWISSAITALYMVQDQYYVVDVDRSGTGTDRNANVIILDRDTGTDQVSSQWDEAMHQFLQLKHGCKLSTLSLKAVFISNVTYFKEYELLYGLTGTLGTKEERDLLKEIHDVDFVTVPTFKMKQFEECESVICSNCEDWKQEIRQEVNKLINTENRSVLMICETVQDVEALQLTLGSEEHKNILTYKRDYEELTIAKDGLKSGHIIIATNLAGRGTDIKISEELEKAGGLHVVLTYLPANIRIEEQAFGRAARKGEKGSGRMIIMAADGKSHSNFKIYSLKLKRNADELLRLAAIKTYYEKTIITEENCFKSFKNLYEQLRNSLNKTPDQVKEILLQSCLDKWSFWLDENNALIGSNR